MPGLSTATRQRSARNLSVAQYVTVEAARPLVGRPGKPAARHTVLTLGIRGDLDIRQNSAGHLVVMLDSITRYNERRGVLAG